MKTFLENLEVGQCYLHKNSWTYRKNVEFYGDDIYYPSPHGLDLYSVNHFIRICPKIATSEEIAEIGPIKNPL